MYDRMPQRSAQCDNVGGSNQALSLSGTIMNGATEGERSIPYDELAAHYRSVSAARAAYLRAIEEIIIQRITGAASSLLDVGSADGHRAMRIAESAHISNVVLVEPSAGMRKLCGQRTQAVIWPLRAEELPDAEDRFSVITCLWNVLGHIETNQKRLTALTRMRRLLGDDGVIFIDVNNRYNAVNYGVLPTVGRMLYDLVAPSETNGDAQVTWTFGAQRIQSPTHVFTPREIATLLRDAGLIVKQKFAVDYRTGQVRRSTFAGQLLFELGKNE